jgi:integrase
MATVEKRSDTTYRLVIYAGSDVNGKAIRKRKNVTIDAGLTEKQKKKELDKQVSLFEQEVQNGTYCEAGKMKLKEFSELWLKNHVDTNLAPGTAASYRKKLKNRIIPALGHIHLDKLQPLHIIEFYKDLVENGIRDDSKYTLNETYRAAIIEVDIRAGTLRYIRKGKRTNRLTAEKISAVLGVPIDKAFTAYNSKAKLSDCFIHSHHSILSSMLASAVEWQVIAANPCDRVTPPKVKHKEAHSYDEEEVIALLEKLENAPLKYQCGVYIALFGGLRLGEIIALEWADLDFDMHVIRVNKQTQYTAKLGCFEADPKTERSNRSVVLPRIVFDKLRVYKRFQTEERLKAGDSWQDKDKIFTKVNGDPVHYGTLTVWFNEWLKKEELPPLKFHGLRHTNASLMLAGDVDLAVISSQLGHTNISITERLYIHAVRRKKLEAAEKLEAWAERSLKKGSSNPD